MLGRMSRAIACLVLVAAAGAALAVTAQSAPVQARCQPTLGDGAGPFQANAIATPLRSKIGTGHVLLGRVLAAPDCGPVRRAVVYFWQAGPNGYGPRGRGRVLTDRQGRFRIEGPVPANYGRGPHIHLAVLHPAYEELLTRYVVRPGAKSGRIRLVLAPLL
jgi:protocatechuate 3,4-dioxygenase beta subunit